MYWVVALSCAVSIAASAAAALLWRRVRLLERRLLEPKNPSHYAADAFQSMELTLEAMLEELERKCREALDKIDRAGLEWRESAARLAARQVDPNPAKAGPDRAAEPGAPVAAAEPAQPSPQRGPWQEKSDAILRLAAEGLDVVAIAQRLGLGKGEVQLVLDLRKSL